MKSSFRRLAMALAFAVLGGVCATTYVRGQRIINPNNSKSSFTFESVFTSVVKQATKSTVRVFVDSKGSPEQVALGTIVSADGFVLTKGSEVMGHSKITVVVSTIKGTLEAKIVGWSEPLDLAMLKIEAKGLTPVTFADTRPPAGSVEPEPAAAPGPVGPPGSGPGGVGGFQQGAPGPNAGGRGAGRGGRGGGRGAGGGGRGVRGAGGPVVVPTAAEPAAPPEGAIPITVGEWVASVDAGATAGAELPPKYVGVISVARRRIPKPDSGAFLGISFGDPSTPDILPTTTKVVEVLPDTGADRGKVLAGDVILAIDATPVKDLTELKATLRNYNVGDAITLTVQRGEQKLPLRVILGVNSRTDPEMELLTGKVSKRSTNFPAVFQHDTLLEPTDCGGPLVDLDGHVLGINIARAGRTEAYALPADIITPLLPALKSGELAPVNANTPKPVEK